MKIITKTCVALLLLLASCSQSLDSDLLVDDSKGSQAAFSANPYYVDYETALEEAINFMTDGKTTRAVGRSFDVKEHFEYVANRSPFYNTRATNNQDTIDVRFHVINFADNGGFALVSADSRTTPIYAYSEEGYLDIDDAIANTGFDVFMDGAEVYYREEICRSRHIFPDSITINPEWFEDKELITYNGIQYYAGPPYYTAGFNKLPLISTTWNQPDPYNYYCPILNDLNIPSTWNGRAVAGCVPVAIGQIMAYHHHIASGLFKKGYDYSTHSSYYTNDTLTVNWAQVCSANSYEYNVYSGGSLETANLLSQLGLYAEATYGLNGTGVYNYMINPTLITMGYTSSGLTSFVDESVIFSINANKPVLARGCRLDGDILVGHAWVIDGFQSEQEVRDCYSTLFPYNYVRTIKTGNDIYYHHCNWGWGGNYNAYVLNTFQATPDRIYQYDRAMICNITPQ